MTYFCQNHFSPDFLIGGGGEEGRFIFGLIGCDFNESIHIYPRILRYKITRHKRGACSHLRSSNGRSVGNNDSKLNIAGFEELPNA
jgi:hypothetical protein